MAKANPIRHLNIDTHLSPLPWWFTAIKWGIPLVCAGFTSLVLGAITTGYLGAPAALEGLASIAVLYGNLSAFAAFALLSTVMIMSAVVIGGALSLLTRAGLLGIAESYNSYNVQNAKLFAKVTQAKQHEKMQAVLDERDEFVVEKDRMIKKQEQEIKSLREQLLSRPTTAPVLHAQPLRQPICDTKDRALERPTDDVELSSASSSDDETPKQQEREKPRV